jgi:hypothetical protein
MMKSLIHYREDPALLTDPKNESVPQVVLKMLHLSNMLWSLVKTQVQCIIKELKLICDGLKEKLVMTSEEMNLEILKEGEKGLL